MKYTFRLCTAALTLLMLQVLPAPSSDPATAVDASLSRGGAGSACLAAHHVQLQAGQGVFKLTIPLVVSLEWNTLGSDDFVWWQMAMQQASEFLQDATGRQASIGQVNLFDNACQWAVADIRVYAHNTAVPDATIGGLSASTYKALRGSRKGLPIAFAPSISSGRMFPLGAIRVGRAWSEHGPLAGRWTEPDGFRTIVHELGHYAFFLYDEYFGYDTNSANNPRPPTSCVTPGQGQAPASLMYWEYTRDTFWYLPPGVPPAPNCEQSRQWQVYGMSDWAVIRHHYPRLKVPNTVTAPNRPGCAWCSVPRTYRWQLSQVDKRSTAADAYLAKSDGARVLHQGVPYPPGQLEILGGGKGDVVRITGAKPGSGAMWQASLVLTGNRGDAVIQPHLPHWYGDALNVQKIPAIDATPLLTRAPQGQWALTGLQVTTLDPDSAQPLPLIKKSHSISATLFEAGLGPDNRPRHPTTVLMRSGSASSGHLSLVSSRFPRQPIVDGALYLTPNVSGRPQQPPNRPDGDNAAWALAYLSLSCNAKTQYLTGHAPGDEGGLDSADGVVNVHLSSSDPTLQNFCVAFTAQAGLAQPAGGVPLTGLYALHGVVPGGGALSSSSRARATITFHYDQKLLAGRGPAIEAVPLPGKRRRLNPSDVHEYADPCDDTVTADVPLWSLSGFRYRVAAGAHIKVTQNRSNCQSKDQGRPPATPPPG